MALNELGERPTVDEHVRLLARLSRLFETRLAQDSMTLPQFRLLAFLSEGEWAASALAEWLAVSRPSITALVDGVVDRGWVERHESPDDRRRVLHQITDDGLAALQSSSRGLRGTLDELLGQLDASDRRTAEDGLDVVAVAMRRNWTDRPR